MSSYLGYIYPISQALSVSYPSTVSKRNEDSVRTGHNYYATTLFQSMQVSFAMDLATQAVTLANRTINPLFRAGAYTLPYIFSYAASRDIQNSLLKKSVYFIHDHIGTICQIASIASSVALYVLGNQVFAAVCLLQFTVGFIDRNGFVPFLARKPLHYTEFFIGTTASLIVGNWIAKVVAVINISSLALSFFIKGKEDAIINTVAYQAPDAGPTPVTLDEVETFSTNMVEVNKAHVNYSIPLTPPNVQLKELFDIEKEIDWNVPENKEILQKILDQDERWLKRGTGIDSIAFLKKNLSGFVTRIENKSILQGQISSYDLLEYYTKHIVQRLKDPNLSEEQKVTTIAVLAIQAGEYCGPGVYNTVELTYNSLLSLDSSLPLNLKVLHQLRLAREAVFQNFYNVIFHASGTGLLVSRISNYTDIHTYNEFVNAFGTRFGLPSSSAQNDETALTSPTEKIALGILSHYFTDTIFWEGNNNLTYYAEDQLPPFSLSTIPDYISMLLSPPEPRSRNAAISGYTVERIVESLQELIGKAGLPKEKVSEWWEDWYKERNPSASEEDIYLFKEDMWEEKEVLSTTLRPTSYKSVITDLVENSLKLANSKKDPTMQWWGQWLKSKKPYTSSEEIESFIDQIWALKTYISINPDPYLSEENKESLLKLVRINPFIESLLNSSNERNEIVVHWFESNLPLFFKTKLNQLLQASLTKDTSEDEGTTALSLSDEIVTREAAQNWCKEWFFATHPRASSEAAKEFLNRLWEKPVVRLEEYGPPTVSSELKTSYAISMLLELGIFKKKS